MQTIKNIYASPEIKEIGLDNEISLILVSEPPFGPGEEYGVLQSIKFETKSTFYQDS
ncbi:MAG: hypothetical protein RBT57_04830 [Paludibacter sp.]|jgi:hypothetical protein|nr:hypothetical protein [Paludibacter sp.]